MRLIKNLSFSLDKIIYFGIAFALMLWYLIPMKDMLLGGGDATNIWQTISSFYSSKVVASYVLYKGFLSIYPYVWLYKASSFLGLNDFFFIKLYHCVLFSYVSAIGVPYFIAKILHIDLKPWRRITLIILLFTMWKYNGALQMLMIDLPSLAVFILCVNAALKISEKGIKTSKLYLIYAGIMFGFGLCFSGQYTIAILCIILYVIIKTIRFKKIQESSICVTTIIAIICIASGIFSVKMYNSYFDKSFVQPFRDSGEWIPTKTDLIAYGVTSSIPWYGKFNPHIYSNRGEALIKNTEGNKFNQVFKSQQAGIGPWYTPKQLIKMFIKHPMDFIAGWCNRLFIGLSPDNGRRSIPYLYIAYTSLFICFLVFRKKCTTLKVLLSTPSLLILAFVFSALVPCIWQLEMRYVMAIQGLIFGIAFLDDTVWDGLFKFWRNVRQCIIDNNLKPFLNKKFSYVFVFYLVFVFLCFTHFGTLLELNGTDPNIILFNW